MSHTTHLANRFPLWSKVRTDPSSLGQRLLSIWADYFDWAYADTKRIANDKLLFKRGLGVGYLYQLELDGEDLIPSTVSKAGEQIYTYPTTVLGNGNTLIRVDNIDELCWSTVDELVEMLDDVPLETTLVYEDLRAGTKTLNPIRYSAHLQVEVVDSLDFYKKTPLRNARASGKHLLIIRGLDVNGLEIEEHVAIPDDGYYWTRNVFTEVLEVVPEGFSGDIRLTIGEPAGVVTDPFRLCALEDGSEGPLRLDITDHAEGSVLRYFTYITRQGESYRDGNVEIVPNEEDAWEQHLLDVNGDPVEAVALAVNPNTTQLYAVTADGVVHVYEHKQTVFSPARQDIETESTCLESSPLKHWALMGEQMRLFTRFVRVREPIVSVSIQRMSPSDVLEYLQANKTWAAAYYEFKGNIVVGGLPEETWSDFDYQCVFNELGQWDFYTTTKTNSETTVSYTAVMVDGLRALATLPTGYSQIQDILFGPADELLLFSNVPTVDTDMRVHVLAERRNTYMIDPSNQLMYLREFYEDGVELMQLYPAEQLTLLPFPTALDETGIGLGLNRIDGETLYAYQRRLILESRQPAGPTEIEFVRSVSRQVGVFDEPVLRIDLADNSTAENPFIEVSSSRLKVYSDYENKVLSVEVDFTDREDGYFLRDIVAAFAGNTDFTCEVLDPNYEFKHSSQLRYSNTDVHIVSELLLPSTENRLKNDHLKSFYPQNSVAFVNEVLTLGDIDKSGDYYVDYAEGVVYSYEVQAGFTSYTYSELPFTLWHSPIKVYPYLDKDKKYFLYDPVVSDTTGLLDDFSVLNIEGSHLANTVLRLHPLTFGV